MKMNKADIYIKGMQDGMRPFEEKVNAQADKLRDVAENLGKQMDDVIDAIEWNNKFDDPEEIIKLLKEKKLNLKKLKQFKISIIYNDKENEEFAETLRKALNDQKHSCEQKEYSDFKKHVGSSVDYRIYIGNPEKVKEERKEEIYNAYGMKILAHKDDYIVVYDKKYDFTDSEKEKFILYYESVISKVLEKSKKAKKALKERKERREKNPDPGEPDMTYKVLELLEEKLESSLDFWDDKPEWMSVVLGIPHKVLLAAAMLIGGICLIPVGVGEIIFDITLDGLKEADFDGKFVGDAQKQILEVKILEIFKHKQMEDIICEGDGQSFKNLQDVVAEGVDVISEEKKGEMQRIIENKIITKNSEKVELITPTVNGDKFKEYLDNKKLKIDKEKIIAILDDKTGGWFGENKGANKNLIFTVDGIILVYKDKPKEIVKYNETKAFWKGNVATLQVGKMAYDNENVYIFLIKDVCDLLAGYVNV